MRRLRKLAGVLVVWATAASTLLGTAPRFVCRCPDGSIKYFCFGPVVEEPSSCCGKSCCGNGRSEGQQAASEKSNKSKPPCCALQKATPANPGPVGAQRTINHRESGEAVVKPAGCQKSLEQSKIRSLARANADICENHCISDGVSPACDVSNAHLPTGSQPRIWQMHGPPPPTDFVTTLHRLTI